MSHQFFTQPVWKDNMYCLMPPSIASSGELTLTEFLNACWTTFCLPWYLINSTHQLVSKFWHIFAQKPNSNVYLFKSMFRNLYKHAEPLRSYPSFCRIPFLPNITECKNGLLKLNQSTVYI